MRNRYGFVLRHKSRGLRSVLEQLSGTGHRLVFRSDPQLEAAVCHVPFGLLAEETVGGFLPNLQTQWSQPRTGYPTHTPQIRTVQTTSSVKHTSPGSSEYCQSGPDRANTRGFPPSCEPTIRPGARRISSEGQEWMKLRSKIPRDKESCYHAPTRLPSPYQATRDATADLRFRTSFPLFTHPRPRNQPLTAAQITPTIRSQ